MHGWVKLSSRTTPTYVAATHSTVAHSSARPITVPPITLSCVTYAPLCTLLNMDTVPQEEVAQPPMLPAAAAPTPPLLPPPDVFAPLRRSAQSAGHFRNHSRTSGSCHLPAQFDHFVGPSKKPKGYFPFKHIIIDVLLAATDDELEDLVSALHTRPHGDYTVDNMVVIELPSESTSLLTRWVNTLSNWWVTGAHQAGILHDYYALGSVRADVALLCYLLARPSAMDLALARSHTDQQTLKLFEKLYPLARLDGATTVFSLVTLSDAGVDSVLNVIDDTITTSVVGEWSAKKVEQLSTAADMFAAVLGNYRIEEALNAWQARIQPVAGGLAAGLVSGVVISGFLKLAASLDDNRRARIEGITAVATWVIQAPLAAAPAGAGAITQPIEWVVGWLVRYVMEPSHRLQQVCKYKAFLDGLRLTAQLSNTPVTLGALGDAVLFFEAQRIVMNANGFVV